MNRKVNELKPHELNHQIYLNFEGKERVDFINSVKEQGIIEPLIIKEDGTILSGHRRWEAAKEVGLVEVPVVIAAPENDSIFLIEANRYRQKKVSELMMEAETLEREIAAQIHHRTYVEKLPGISQDGGSTRDRVATLTGIGSGRQYDKMKRIWEEAKINPNIAAKVEKIDKGEASVDGVFKLVTGKIDEAGLEDFEPKVYNSWAFGQNDPRFGIPHPGRIPGQIVQNFLYYYTDPGALLIDPFGGGGVSLDVCKVMDRRCLAYDIEPMRPDISQHDISTGFPDEAQGCDAIFMDPPYWNMVAENYTEASSSSMSYEGFCAFIRKLIFDAAQTVRLGGHVGLIIMTQLDRLPEGLEYIDWPFKVYQNMLDAGLTPVQRIGVNWPTSQYMGFHVTMAKEKRRMLGLLGDLIVMRRDQ